MVNSTTKKRCRKSIEGYSEIVEYNVSDDHLFRRQNKCACCRKLVTTLLVIVIGIGLGSLAVVGIQYGGEPGARHERQIIEPNATYGRKNTSNVNSAQMLDVPLHDRKKRNASNETDVEEIIGDSGFVDSYEKITRTWSQFNTAMQNFLNNVKASFTKANMSKRETQRSTTLRAEPFDSVETTVNVAPKITLSSNVSDSDTTSSIDRGTTSNTASSIGQTTPQVFNVDTTKATEPSTAPPETATDASSSTFATSTAQSIEQSKLNILDELNRSITLPVLTYPDENYQTVTEHITNTPDASVSAGVTDDSSQHTRQTDDAETTGAFSTNATTLSIGTSPASATIATQTEPENGSKNDPLNHNVSTPSENTVGTANGETSVETSSAETPAQGLTEITNPSTIALITEHHVMEIATKTTQQPASTTDANSTEENISITGYDPEWNEKELRRIFGQIEAFKDTPQGRQILELLNRQERGANYNGTALRMNCFRTTLEGETINTTVEIPLSKARPTPRGPLPSTSTSAPPYERYETDNDTNEALFRWRFNDTSPEYNCTFIPSTTAKESSESSIPSEKSLDDYNGIRDELCDEGERACNDGKCISKELWCNAIVNCADRSDESSCTCKDRVHVDKRCDGYFDCPDGKDEQGCFDCPDTSFSCDDWVTWKPNSTCVPMSKRCDGVIDCPWNFKDEEECDLLADKIFSHETFLVSYTSGFLHHNYKGQWYPVCADVKSVHSTKACQSELGIYDIIAVETSLQTISQPYSGKYVSSYGDKIVLVDQCDTESSVVYVKCPKHCGTRVRTEHDHLRYRHKRETEIETNSTDNFQINHKGNPRSEERVVGGRASAPGHWPWIVALYRDGIFHCGAAILDEDWILTAAHCVDSYQNHYFEIQAGTLRRYSFSPTEQNCRVIDVIVHSDYDTNTMINDIALLRVDPPLKMNRWVRQICLHRSSLAVEPTPGTICTAVGWGATREHGPDPDNMREVELPILPQCKHPADIKGNEICAGYLSGGHDTCQGDSGGPLLCRSHHLQDQWYVAGIVSHGEGCARRNEPGVYTRVSLYLPWIYQNTNPQNLLSSRNVRQHCPGMRCSDDGRCIAQKQKCDTVIDCLNGEDELKCDRPQSPNLPLIPIWARGSESNQNISQSWVRSTTFKNLIGLNELRSHERSNETTTVKNDIKWGPHWSPRLDFPDDVHVEKFECEIIPQVMPKDWYCDGQVDCEDGTDEINCTCFDILKTKKPSSICDGLPDCYDLSDEKNCTAKNCGARDFLCYRSYTCINATRVCDGNFDCPNKEDEQHCYILSENFKITLGNFNIPISSSSGMISINRNGLWIPYCMTTMDPYNEMLNICKYLGFKRHSYKVIQLLQQTSSGYIECISAKLTCENRQDELEVLPWNVNIYVNGVKNCAGLLLTNEWIVANYNCTHHDLGKDYLVAVLGGNRVMEDVIQTFNEQLVRIDQIFFSEKTQTTMMHLEAPIKITRYATPIQVFKQTYWNVGPAKEAECFAIADSEYPVMVPILPLEDCNHPLRCKYKLTNKAQFCLIHNHGYTVSSIMCTAPSGYWYLAASVRRAHFDQYCSTNQTSFTAKLWEDPAELDTSQLIKTPPPHCFGHRCALGKCVPMKEICDGIPHCRNGEDETPALCKKKTTLCLLPSNALECGCKTHQLQCKNGKCVDRKLICDNQDDCGDGTDEPSECANFTCATYLKIVQPARLCDGRVDCLDKSDENLSKCPSFCSVESHFKCPKSSKCIPREFVCDGEADCPDNEDESQCWKLISNERNSTEANLFILKYGQWQKYCWTHDVTGFQPEYICDKLDENRKHRANYSMLASTWTPTHEFRKVTLSPSKIFKLRTKPLLQSNSTETCYNVHLKCE